MPPDALIYATPMITLRRRDGGLLPLRLPPCCCRRDARQHYLITPPRYDSPMLLRRRFRLRYDIIHDAIDAMMLRHC